MVASANSFDNTVGTVLSCQRWRLDDSGGPEFWSLTLCLSLAVEDLLGSQEVEARANKKSIAVYSWSSRFEVQKKGCVISQGYERATMALETINMLVV